MSHILKGVFLKGFDENQALTFLIYENYNNWHKI